MIFVTVLSFIGVNAKYYPNQECKQNVPLTLETIPNDGTNGCTKPIDLVVIIDESVSVDNCDFYREVKFVKNVVARMNLKKSNSRIGLITFSTESFVYSKLTDDENELFLKLENLNQRGGDATYMGAAFRQAEDLFRNNQRENVPQIIIFMTDGEPTEDRDEISKVADYYSRNYIVFSVAVGQALSNSNRAEFIRTLKQFASAPKDQHFAAVSNYADLSKKLWPYLQTTCQIPPPNCDGKKVVVALPQCVSNENLNVLEVLLISELYGIEKDIGENGQNFFSSAVYFYGEERPSSQLGNFERTLRYLKRVDLDFDFNRIVYGIEKNYQNQPDLTILVIIDFNRVDEVQAMTSVTRYQEMRPQARVLIYGVEGPLKNSGNLKPRNQMMKGAKNFRMFKSYNDIKLELESNVCSL